MGIDDPTQSPRKPLETESVPDAPDGHDTLDIRVHLVHAAAVRRTRFLDIAPRRGARATLPEDGFHDEDGVDGTHEQQPAELRDRAQLEPVRGYSQCYTSEGADAGVQGPRCRYAEDVRCHVDAVGFVVVDQQVRDGVGGDVGTEFAELEDFEDVFDD